MFHILNVVSQSHVLSKQLTNTTQISCCAHIYHTRIYLFTILLGPDQSLEKKISKK